MLRRVANGAEVAAVLANALKAYTLAEAAKDTIKPAAEAAEPARGVRGHGGSLGARS